MTRRRASALPENGFRCGWSRSSVGYVLTIWIARLLISERVAQKIIEVHGISLTRSAPQWNE